MKSDLLELQNMHRLKELVLWDTNAQTLNGLSNLTELTELKLIRAKKLIDITGLENSKNLDFITDFHNLKEISFDKVIDGNLTPLLKSQSLERAFFVSRKTYNYSEKEVNKKLGEMR